MSQAEEVTGPLRLPNGVADYLQRGTTPVELAESETRAAADSDGGRSYESARAYLSRPVAAPAQPREGKGIMTLLGEALGRDREAADPEAGA